MDLTNFGSVFALALGMLPSFWRYRVMSLQEINSPADFLKSLDPVPPFQHLRQIARLTCRATETGEDNFAAGTIRRTRMGT
jgi:hypothetical protein